MLGYFGVATGIDDEQTKRKPGFGVSHVLKCEGPGAPNLSPIFITTQRFRRGWGCALVARRKTIAELECAGNCFCEIAGRHSLLRVVPDMTEVISTRRSCYQPRDIIPAIE